MVKIKLYFTKEETKTLKYIKKHKRVTEPMLKSKFPNFDNYRHYISSFIDRKDLNEEEFKRREFEFNKQHNGPKMPVSQAQQYQKDFEDDENKIIYSLSRQGYEYFYDKWHEALLFWLPYGITTFIALSSVILQALNYCSNGTP